MAFTQWSKEKIIEQIHYLSNIPNANLVEMQTRDISHLQELLKLYSLKSFTYDSPLSWQEMLEDDRASIFQYRDFLDDIKAFSMHYPKIQLVPYQSIFEISNLGPKLIFEFLKDFFHHFDPVFGQKFDRVFKDRFENLMFSSSRSISFHVASLEYTYINIEKSQTLADFLSAVHEYTHAIVNLICYRENSENYPFGELPSEFMEIVAADYLMECFLGLEDDLNTLRLSLCEDITIYCENISIGSAYLLSKNTFGDKNTVISDLQGISGKSKKYLKRIFHTSALEKLNYSIAYITAIELYFIYKQDPKECIKLLNYLMTMKRDNDYNQALRERGIILNEHSEEWVKTLIKKETG